MLAYLSCKLTQFCTHGFAGSMSAVPGVLKEGKHEAAGSESESREGAPVPTFFSCSRCHQVNSVDVRPIRIAGSEKVRCGLSMVHQGAY